MRYQMKGLCSQNPFIWYLSLNLNFRKTSKPPIFYGTLGGRARLALVHCFLLITICAKKISILANICFSFDVYRWFSFDVDNMDVFLTSGIPTMACNCYAVIDVVSYIYIYNEAGRVGLGRQSWFIRSPTTNVPASRGQWRSSRSTVKF